MTKEINYTADWHMDCPQSREQWAIFVTIMESFGVAFHNEKYAGAWAYLSCRPEGGTLTRRNIPLGKKVSLLEAITLLQRTAKTPQQVKIEELEATILKAQTLIKSLKGLPDDVSTQVLINNKSYNVASA